mgnify:CR=1 FL=1
MRKAGVLMPVSALPSRIGAGELGESAFHFIELLKENHVKNMADTATESGWLW